MAHEGAHLLHAHAPTSLNCSRYELPPAKKMPIAEPKPQPKDVDMKNSTDRGDTMAVSLREETENSEGHLSGAEWFRFLSGAVTGDIILLATTTVSLIS